MYKIMLVEDDAQLSDVISRQLRNWGNEVFTVQNFQNVLYEFTEIKPHLVLLDIMLPFYNGYYWCEQIRKISGVPILFISSASDNMNLVMAINMGGDDFIAKPFDPDVLNAKVQAILRRTYDLIGQVPMLIYEGANLNINDMTLSFEKEKIELSKNEFRIMQTLMEQKGKVVSRSALMMKLWENDCYVEENTLTVNINRLRKKLEGIGLKDYIKTKVKEGYYI